MTYSDVRSGAAHEVVQESGGQEPRVCIVSPGHWDAHPGGSEYQAKLLIDCLLQRFKVALTYVGNWTPDISAKHEYPIIKISTPWCLRKYGAFFDALPLYLKLKRIRPDIVYQIVGCAHTGISAFFAKRNKSLMIWRVASDRDVSPEPILWWRKPHELVERKFLDYGIRNAAVVLAQTKTQQRLLAENFGRTDSVLVRNYHPWPEEKVRKDSGQIKILWIGNLKRLKNPEAFIRLAAQFQQRPDVEFIMVGRESDVPAWVESVKQKIAACPNIMFLGSISQEQVNSLLAESHLLVNTSDYEGFPNTFIQAWMRQVPVVSLCVDPDDLLSERGLGRVCRTEGRLFEETMYLINDLKLCEELGRQCQVYALEQHSEKNMGVLFEMMRLVAKDEGCKT